MIEGASMIQKELDANRLPPPKHAGKNILARSTEDQRTQGIKLGVEGNTKVRYFQKVLTKK